MTANSSTTTNTTSHSTTDGDATSPVRDYDVVPTQSSYKSSAMTANSSTTTNPTTSHSTTDGDATSPVRDYDDVPTQSSYQSSPTTPSSSTTTNPTTSHSTIDGDATSTVRDYDVVPTPSSYNSSAMTANSSTTTNLTTSNLTFSTEGITMTLCKTVEAPTNVSSTGDKTSVERLVPYSKKTMLSKNMSETFSFHLIWFSAYIAGVFTPLMIIGIVEFVHNFIENVLAS